MKVPVAKAVHTIRVDGDALELTNVIAFEGDTGEGVRVTNMGRSATNIDHWLFDSGNNRGGIGWTIDAAKADLMVWMPISNDRSDNVGSYKIQARQVIQRQKATGGDVLVIIPCMPGFNELGGTEANWKAICTAFYELADELDFPILDLTWAWGDFYQSNARGLFADFIHEGDVGLELIAGATVAPLTLT